MCVHTCMCVFNINVHEGTLLKSKDERKGVREREKKRRNICKTQRA